MSLKWVAAGAGHPLPLMCLWHGCLRERWVNKAHCWPAADFYGIRVLWKLLANNFRVLWRPPGKQSRTKAQQTSLWEDSFRSTKTGSYWCEQCGWEGCSLTLSWFIVCCWMGWPQAPWLHAASQEAKCVGMEEEFWAGSSWLFSMTLVLIQSTLLIPESKSAGKAQERLWKWHGKLSHSLRKVQHSSWTVSSCSISQISKYSELSLKVWDP